MDDHVRARLEAVLAERDLAALWLVTPGSLRWAVGADATVDRTAPEAVGALRFDGTTLSALAPENEAARLRDEELPEEVPLETAPWHEGTAAGLVADRAGPDAGADTDLPGLARVPPHTFRLPLVEGEVDTVRRLGTTVAGALETVARAVGPATTEQETARRLRARLLRAGVETPVTLVGGAERAPRYRHPVPTETPLGGYAVLSVTARRAGLYVSATRTVAFDPPGWLADRHAAAAEVEAAALAATRAVGRAAGTAGEVLERVRAAYERVGWAGEWRAHHQGGATGYAGREWVATPGDDTPVPLGAPYAWNPTVAGAKSEDTVLVTADGLEVLTATGDWPTRTVSGDGLAVERPRPLDRTT